MWFHSVANTYKIHKIASLIGQRHIFYGMSEQGSVKKSSLSRRDFLRLMAAGGVAVAFTPLIPFGNYMPNPKTRIWEEKK